VRAREDPRVNLDVTPDDLAQRASAFVPARAAAPRKVVIAMSGGVDSSVAAWLLKEQGHEVIGVGLRLAPDAPGTQAGEGRCCSVDDLTDARRVADKLGIPFFAVDARDRFRDAVLQPFVEATRAGLTPIPCLACNHDVKIGDLQKTARSLGAALATGHYARRVERAGSQALARPVDASRDQTYYLYGTPHEDIADLLLPLGDLDKPFVRALASRIGLAVATKPDSQEICFVPDGDVGSVVEQHGGGGRVGELVHIQTGKKKTHTGVHRFTVGQRRGVGVSASELGIAEHERAFVVDVDGASGIVSLGPKAALDVTRVRARPLRLAQPLASWPALIRVQVRARATPVLARWQVIESESGSELEVHTLEPVSAVALGQALVCYDDDVLLGGGILVERMDGAAPRRQAFHEGLTRPAAPRAPG
jgi:tRNA-uridine 2-sulfurtransferase